MQGLADGYFIIPYTIGNYLARQKFTPVPADHADVRAAEKAVAERTAKLLAIKGKRSPTSFHRDLGKIMPARTPPDSTSSRRGSGTSSRASRSTSSSSTAGSIE